MSPVHHPGTVDEALDLLAAIGDAGAPLAGGTWIMRAPIRREPFRSDYVALQGLTELRGIELRDGYARIGALATHAEIGGIDAAAGPLGGIAEAARRSAFPAVRNVATLGGNLASPFPEADLVPPLLAAEAVLDVQSPHGAETVDVAAYVDAARSSGELIVAARVPAPPGRRSWFERLTVRAAAEYSIVSVAASIDVARDGAVSEARIAVGAVSDAPMRVHRAEAAITGRRLDAVAIKAAGDAAGDAVTGRDAPDAPAWYRVAVLGTLVGRVLERLGGREG
jgi:aerobic carbon-monoxide dehydrogenase medium subunit